MLVDKALQSRCSKGRGERRKGTCLDIMHKFGRITNRPHTVQTKAQVFPGDLNFGTHENDNPSKSRNFRDMQVTSSRRFTNLRERSPGLIQLVLLVPWLRASARSLRLSP